MTKKKKIAAIKELIIAKKLLQNSEVLIKSDTLENNLVAVSNLNSALNIFLRILSRQQKIRSTKELDNISLEKQWSILSEKYEHQFGQKLSMKTQIFTLSNITQNFIEHDIVPSNSQLQELCQALNVFMHELTLKLFELDFQKLGFHLLLENKHVQRTLKAALDAFEDEDYEQVLKNSSLAFHIALEDQRHKINYLSEKGLLKPEPFMLDKSIKLHIDSKDQEFIHLVLGTPPLKHEHFKKIVPTAIISEDERNRPEIILSNFVDDTAISKENAQFCLNFVLETILQWENQDLMRK